VRVYDLRRAIENLPDYLWPGAQKNEAVATGTDGRAFSTDQQLTGKWTGTAYPDSVSVSSSGTTKSQQKHVATITANKPNPFGFVRFRDKKRPRVTF
jgi:hypothetical protein